MHAAEQKMGLELAAGQRNIAIVQAAQGEVPGGMPHRAPQWG